MPCMIVEANNDVDVARACRLTAIDLLAPVPLHPDTDPAAIAAAQRAVVAACLAARPGPLSDAAVSDEVCLPVWVVRRRREELALERRRTARAHAAPVPRV